MSNLTKAQCLRERNSAQRIADAQTDPVRRLAFQEQAIWWGERYGELIAADPTFRGRKFHK